MARRLTPGRERALRRLAKVKDGCALKCEGHMRVNCHGLVELGLAVCVAELLDSGLASAFQITEAGRSHPALKDGD